MEKRQIIRAVPAHRTLGGGLGRRYDEAVRSSWELEHLTPTQKRAGPSEAQATGCVAGCLTSLCIDALVESWEGKLHLFVPAAYRIPGELAGQLICRLVATRKLSDPVLSGLLSPALFTLDLTGCDTIRNSVLKQIGLCCLRITYLNLSNCVQVNNAVVRSVLQGCSSLRQLYLDGCRRITDAGFHLQQSPFHLLVGCVSLETLSVSHCPQVSGRITTYLQKMCRNLRELNISQCKSVGDDSIRNVFESCGALESLNISYLEHVTDEAFATLSEPAASGPDAAPPELDSAPPLRHLNLSLLNVGDATVSRLGGLRNLESVHLQSCLGVSDLGVEGLTRGCVLLRALDLSNCAFITDTSLASVGRNCHKTLEWLNVSWCSGITDSGVQHLTGCHELEEVSMVWCCGVTDVGMRALVKACTNLMALSVTGTKVASATVEELRQRGLEVTHLASGAEQGSGVVAGA